MKLIIDIPEEIVTAIQNGQDYRYDIHTAIAQGKPCDASGDLISRNALIQHTYSAVVDGVETDIIDASDVDNAPTVDITETISKFRNTAYQNGFTTGLNKRPQGDLISREALKKALNEATYNFEQIPIRVDKVQEIIDNAPTIKTFTLADIEDQYRKGLEKGLSEWETERPQGEWNYIQAGMCVCPFCGAMPHKEYKNFCANCGADMRGKEK